MFESRIFEIMKEKGKTLQDLIKATGLPRTTLLRLVRDADLGKVTLSTLVTISIALNCRVENLFFHKNDE